MLLLTWHGTLVCLRDDGGGMLHVKLRAAGTGPAPLQLDIGRRLPAAMKLSHPILGEIELAPGPTGAGITLSRFGMYLCAEDFRPAMGFTRQAANVWEEFLPASEEDIADLTQLLSNRWLVRRTRALIPQSAMRFAERFRLMVGSAGIDLAKSLPLSPPADPAALYAPPKHFTLASDDGEISIVLAEPRSSALLKTEIWPVRARRVAEMLAIATHRHLLGREPEQEEFERDVQFLLTRPTAAGLEDLLERMRADPRFTANGRTSPGVAGGQGDAANFTCPTVALGTSCITACTLRRMGLDQSPMPFDWLWTNPPMIRHCIETDFAMLLDRTQYRSLTGKGQKGDPEDGCAHEFYAGKFGVARVFNHNDPTRTADYRYLETCVDRFRDLLATDAPKLFVQVREADAAAEQEFIRTVETLEAATRQASFLQVAVHPPDRSRVVPTLSLAASRGPHALYRLFPTSQMGGEDFERPLDRDFLGWLLLTHARKTTAAVAALQNERVAVQEAMGAFGHAGPTADEATAGGAAAFRDAANHALQRFLARTGLPRRYEFEILDRNSLAGPSTPETCRVRIAGGQVRLAFDPAAREPWVLLQRSLALIYILDAALVSAPLDGSEFLAEFGDVGFLPRSVCFCSNQADSLLIPDSDFFRTGGYEEDRRLVAARAEDWSERKNVVFWRGATTGGRRHAPPAHDADDDFSWLPRLDLCRRTRVSPLAAHYDVAVAAICQMPEAHLVARIAKSGLCRPHAPRSAFLGHKSLLVIDGNSNAWSAMFFALLSGSCVLKVESPHRYRQWYYGDLRPWKHFIPVSEDLGDLDDIVAWMLAHDDDARAIGAAGRAVAEAMSFQSATEDAARRLREWSTR